MSHDYPTNGDNIIDSRDVVKRIAELQSERESLVSALEEAQEARAAFDPKAGGGDESELDQNLFHAKEELQEWNDGDEAEELKALESLQEDAQGYSSDWNHGATLIRDSYFVEYAQDLAEDIGAIDRNQGWPSCHIDWDAAADSLKADYTSVDFDGVEYWIR